jgi:hypothetical protein
MVKQATFSAADCLRISTDDQLINKVLVVNSESQQQGADNQLYFCRGNEGELLYAVSLADGEIGTLKRSSILGILKPDLLPDSARLQLSQLRPVSSSESQSQASDYFGYCFLQDGRYASGVPLANVKDVMDFVEVQKGYQYRVLICDSEDFAVMETVDGKLVYPTEEMLDTFAARLEQQTEEMSMNG